VTFRSLLAALPLNNITHCLLLVSLSFRIAGRGSPTQQNEARPSLPGLCTVKVLPLSALQIVTVLLAVFTARVLQPREVAANFPCDNDEDGVTPCSRHLCSATTKVLLVLAYTHMVELTLVALIVLGLCWFYLRHHPLPSWLGCFVDPRNRFRQAAPSRHASWHGCCRCCCACTSCFTCCVFGGSEVWRSSSSRHAPDHGSSLADISVLLADFFDTGSDRGRLDITPSDLLLGFTVLRLEQRRQRAARLKELREELEQSLFFARDEEEPRPQHSVEASLTSMVLNLEEGNASAAVVTIQSFAIGSFTDSELQEEYEQSNGSGSAEGDIEEGDLPTAFSNPLENSTSSLGVVQNLQMCRTTGEDAQVYFKVTTRRRLRPNQDSGDRQILQDGAYFMRYALAVYGHLMYLAQHTCTAPCCLTVGCLSCRTWSTTERVVQGDNLCRCNELGFLLRADLPHSAIAYASFQTGIQSCPYIISVDPERQAVVLAIQGTFSLESVVTDLNVRPELLELYSDDCPVFAEESMKNEYCHSGMLHCTLHIYKELERHQILDHLLLGPSPKLPGYSLVITGHSLGAGCAAILAVMMRRKFPELRGLCFAPPGCVLSIGSAQDHHITSYVLDADLVPRLSLHSVVGLRNDVIEMIARVKVPKHTILGRGQKNDSKNVMDLVHQQDSIPSSPYYDRVLEFQRHQTQLQGERNVPDVKLCLPGRIVHLIENRLNYSWRHGSSYIPIWAEREDFKEIQLTKNFLVDHDPERYLRILTNTAATMQK
jgi:Lipase (class 3)